MKARGIQSPYAFLRKNNFSQRVAQKLAKGTVSMLKLNHIERLCLLLICEPHDLMVWYPDKDKVYPEENPLNNLRKKESTTNLRQLMNETPYKKLKQLMDEVEKKK